ncbi:TPA: conjugal transfer protein TraG, partial [Streptococcus agalactiae]|nr:conjugal transfer protein TraG [Streptococcus agalactiae]HEO5091365.1 conjugal transfer protein TraG [Streptococcus agalactiae]
VSNHPMKDRLANHYQDKTWYHYKRFMEEGAEFIDAVMTGQIPEDRIWAPDMSDYQAFLEENGFDNTRQSAPETSVHNQVPVTNPEMPSESPSQTPETSTKLVDMDTGEIFELPPEDREGFGEVSFDDQRVEI